MADDADRRVFYAVFYAVVPETLIVADLPSAAKTAWTWLDWKAGTSGLAKASYPEMAAALGCSESSVIRYVRQLIAAGFLKIDRPPSGHGRTWYRVVNAARATMTPSSARAADPSPTSLQDSSRDSISEHSTSATVVSGANSEYSPVTTLEPESCVHCGEPADGKPNYRGDPSCRACEDF